MDISEYTTQIHGDPVYVYDSLQELIDIDGDFLDIRTLVRSTYRSFRSRGESGNFFDLVETLDRSEQKDFYNSSAILNTKYETGSTVLHYAAYYNAYTFISNLIFDESPTHRRKINHLFKKDENGNSPYTLFIVGRKNLYNHPIKSKDIRFTYLLIFMLEAGGCRQEDIDECIKLIETEDVFALEKDFLLRELNVLIPIRHGYLTKSLNKKFLR